MRDFLRRRYDTGTAPRHMWFGVSVEGPEVIGRIRHLQDAPAAVRFVSAEPLLEPLGKADLACIHWVIYGGESQKDCRPMDLAWARGLRDECAAAGVPFFMKQPGGFPDKRGDIALFPEDLRIRDWPECPIGFP